MGEAKCVISSGVCTYVRRYMYIVSRSHCMHARRYICMYIHTYIPGKAKYGKNLDINFTTF